MAECAKYPSAKLCWGQEEHKNSGAYFYCLLRIRSAVAGKREILYGSICKIYFWGKSLNSFILDTSVVQQQMLQLLVTNTYLKIKRNS